MANHVVAQGLGSMEEDKPDQGQGQFALISSSTDGGGKLYYIETSGQTVEMTTANYGGDWT